MSKVRDTISDPGPRTDLGPRKSDYGTPVPVIIQSGRVPGTYVECSNLRVERVEHVTYGPRKYGIVGPKAKYTTVEYKYYGTFVVLLGKSVSLSGPQLQLPPGSLGEAPTTWTFPESEDDLVQAALQVTRIYFNSKPVYELQADCEPGEPLVGGGSANLPCPTIASGVAPGTENTGTAVVYGPVGPDVSGTLPPRGGDGFHPGFSLENIRIHLDGISDRTGDEPRYNGFAVIEFLDVPLTDFGSSFPTVEAVIEECPRTVYPVSAFINKICELSGLEEGTDYQIGSGSGLTNKTLGGYILADANLTAQQALLPFMRLYDIYASEGKGYLEFNARDFTAEGEIRVRDLEIVPVDREHGSVHEEERRPPSDIPYKVTLTALSPVELYEAYAASAQRIVSPITIVDPSKEDEITYTLCTSRDAIKKGAHDILWDEWIHADTLKVRIDRSHLASDTGDLVQVQIPNEVGRSAREGFPGRARVVEVGQDLTIELEAASIIRNFPDFVGDSETVVQPPVPPPPGDLRITDFLMIDGPLIRDVDDPGFETNRYSWPAYWAAGPAMRGRWRGADLLSPADNPIGTTIVPIVRGTIQANLPNPDSWWRTDRVNTLRVSVPPTVRLTTISYADLIGSLPPNIEGGPYVQRNFAMLIGSGANDIEYIKFQTATLVSMTETEAVYDLTNLLRGRRGTEDLSGAATPRIVSGSTFVLLNNSIDPLSLSVVSTSPSGVNLENLLGTHTYTATSKGLTASENVSQDFTLAGRALEPWAPVGLEAVRSGGNVTISWTRRTRLGGDAFTDDGTTPSGNPFGTGSSDYYTIEVAGRAAVDVRAGTSYVVPQGVIGSAATTVDVTLRAVYAYRTTAIQSLPHTATLTIETS